MMDENVRKLTSFPTLQQDNDVVACLENVLNGNAGAEQKGAEMMEGGTSLHLLVLFMQ